MEEGWIGTVLMMRIFWDYSVCFWNTDTEEVEELERGMCSEDGVEGALW